MNNVTLIGRLTRDPEMRYVPNGNNAAVANFNLAVDRNFSKDKREEMEAKNKPTADFINITVWGRQAENVTTYLKKGKKVAVQGRIQTGSYEAKDGTRRYTFEVVANRVEFLEWENAAVKEEDLSNVEGFYSVDSDVPF